MGVASFFYVSLIMSAFASRSLSPPVSVFCVFFSTHLLFSFLIFVSIEGDTSKNKLNRRLAVSAFFANAWQYSNSVFLPPHTNTFDFQSVSPERDAFWLRSVFGFVLY
jgi:hypothetical protein